MGVLQTDAKYTRNGYGTLVTKCLCRKIAIMGFDVYAEVVENNAPSKSLFEKLGFKSIERVQWIVTKGTWTPAQDWCISRNERRNQCSSHRITNACKMWSSKLRSTYLLLVTFSVVFILFDWIVSYLIFSHSKINKNDYVDFFVCFIEFIKLGSCAKFRKKFPKRKRYKKRVKSSNKI